ncbi:hypothetical protein EYZ11_012993 [Aspergillus tanneri]|uniref:Uncharacterized protein n=1 Tax=Aspergillus tanneri TaxID=1220188 RepID=A0A4S3J472_9EURO|nr:hypothetical protein EYZ11_012993 [Aspergillus tanneri]
MVELQAQERTIPTCALIDSGCQALLISRRFADAHLPEPAIGPRRIVALDGHRIRCYGRYRLRATTQDCHGVRRTIERTFDVVDMDHYDAILGYPWLREANPNVDWELGTWEYRKIPPEKEVEIINEAEVNRTLREGKQVYAAYVSTTENNQVEIRVGSATIGEGVRIPAIYKEFEDVFSEENAGILPAHADHDHAIDIQPGKEPPYRPIYPLSESELAVLRRYIEAALEKGWIRPSKSPAGAPIIFVPKSDGTLRLCVDYRGLNEITVKNRYPLPLVSETMDRLAGAKIYTKLDLRDAYHRIRIKKGDEWKTAFRTRYGHFEYTVMPFGLANAPATFQSYINRALSNLLDHCCVVYLDDILIYSQSEEEHVEHVTAVLERLRQFGLYAKLSKCSFHVKSVEYLGFIITPSGIQMEESRVATIQAWPEPTTVREIMIFLGFANFYRRFIEGYSRIALPLTQLTRGEQGGRSKRQWFLNQRLELPEDARVAFNKLKSAFSSAPLLSHYDPRNRTRVETDASGFAISAIISQLQDDNEWHPVAFFSRKMTDSERRYDTHDQELLAIIEAFKVWRHYLEGSGEPIVVKSDHANLSGFMRPTLKRLNGRQARWVELLSAFDFHIEHRPGVKNPADAPSRRPDYLPSADEVSDASLLPTLRSKLKLAMGKSHWDDAPNELKTAWAGIMALDTEGGSKQLNKMSSDAHISMGSMHAHVDKNAPVDEDCAAGVTRILDTWVPRIYVRKVIGSESAYSSIEESMVDYLCKLHQENREVRDIKRKVDRKLGDYGSPAWGIGENGLLRGKRTLEAVERKYYWHGMRGDVLDYVKTCDICQRIQVHRHAPYGKLEPLPVPEQPGEVLTLDFITGLPPSSPSISASPGGTESYDAILVVVDALTKFALYIPCNKDISAPELAHLVYQKVVPMFGNPKRWVSDRGSLFTSSYWSTLCYCLGSKRKLSTAFHPQTDGQTERQNQTLEYYLRAYASFLQDDWVDWLPMAQVTYNAAIHSSTKTSPHEALMGFVPSLRINVDPDPTGHAPAALERATQLKEKRSLVKDALEKAQKAMARQYNKRRIDRQFKIGDQVMLRAKNVSTVRPNAKLDHRQLGPFSIIDAWGNQSYKLQLPPKYRRLHPVFHVSLLEPYHERPGQWSRPPPIPINGEEEWEVDQILEEKRDKSGNISYLVRWKGYPPDDDTWEPRSHVEDTEALDIWLTNTAPVTRRRDWESQEREPWANAMECVQGQAQMYCYPRVVFEVFEPHVYTPLPAQPPSPAQQGDETGEVQQTCDVQ